MTSDEILFDTEERMEKALEVFRNELRGSAAQLRASARRSPIRTRGAEYALRAGVFIARWKRKNASPL